MANLVAEKIFLAGICKYPTTYFKYMQYLKSDEFTHQLTSSTYDSINFLLVNQESESITRSKLISAARTLGHQDYPFGHDSWINELFNEEVQAHELDALFLQVKKESLKVKYTESFRDLSKYLNNTTDSLHNIISHVENRIISDINILDKGEHAIVDMRQGMKEYILGLGDDPGHPGLDLGYPIWQERIGHFRNGSVSLVVSSTGVGKSWIGIKASVSAAKQGLPVLLLDSELNKFDQWTRIAAILTKVPSDIVETGFWKLSERELIDCGIKDSQRIKEIQNYGQRLMDQRIWDIIDKLPIYYQSINSLSIADVIPHMRRWVLTYVKPDRSTRQSQCFIVYDYIKLALTSEIKSGTLQEWQQHGLHVSALHDFSNQYNVPILAFGQTNNEIDDGIRCVAGGKRISENVESVSYFKRKSEKDLAQDNNGSHMIKIFKSRYGKALWNNHINFDADLSCGDFIELGIGSITQHVEQDDKKSD